ncbi:hypothetical protein ACFSUS_20990 [Spirosoma soli]|uniref:Uncharacterized protein n=1 Tax=Spirosoma soli TaxID=1770529 RepID=A0ABW5M9R2_9BACT
MFDEEINHLPYADRLTVLAPSATPRQSLDARCFDVIAGAYFCK